MIRFEIPLSWLVVFFDPVTCNYKIRDVRLPDMSKEMRESFGVEIEKDFVDWYFDQNSQLQYSIKAYLTFWDEDAAAMFKLTHL